MIRTVPSSARVEGMVDAPSSELQQMENLAGQATTEELHNLLSMLVRAEGEMRRSSNPWVALEMTALRMASAPNIVDLSKVISLMDSRIEALPKPAVKAVAATVVPEKDVTGTEEKKESTATAQGRPGRKAQKEKDTSDDLAASEVQSLPTQTPDELWSVIKERINSWGSGPVATLDHGSWQSDRFRSDGG